MTTASETSLVATLRAQEQRWNERPLLRHLYRSWYRELGKRLSTVSGDAIELGSGIATFQEVCPRVRPTDVEATPWTDEVVDAETLPYPAASLSNLILIDVYHHLARPATFLDEAVRVLAPAGRLLILDPYCSPVSTAAYQRFHHERTDLSADAFCDDLSLATDPLLSNQARATLGFFRCASEFESRWPCLRLVERTRLAFVAYPLSGGYSGRQLVSERVGRVLNRVEPALRWLGPLTAFRCLVVIDRRPSVSGVPSATG
jgi:SAM-dependent methyltransferase